MSKYNNEELRAGDTVLVLDIRKLKDPNGFGKIKDMFKFIGKLITIEGVTLAGGLIVKENSWIWCPTWVKKV